MTPRELRIESGLKVEKIAKVLGITRSSVWNKETKKTKLTAREGELLAKLYNLPLETILEAFD